MNETYNAARRASTEASRLGANSKAATATLIVVSLRPGLVKDFLSRTDLRWLGKRSYGIYLWHWPLVVFTLHWSSRLGAAVVTIGGVPVQVEFAGLTPGQIGVYQINVRVNGRVPLALSEQLVITQGTGSTSIPVRVVE